MAVGFGRLFPFVLVSVRLLLLSSPEYAFLEINSVKALITIDFRKHLF